VLCLAGAAAAYALSVLTGVGQGFVYVGVLALIYAVFLSLISRNEFRETWQRWKPLVVVVSALLLGAGVGAFQVLESWQAVRLSIRRNLSYELYSQLSYRPRAAFQAFLVPIYNYIETTPFVLPFVVLLAVVAIVVAFRNRRRDARVLFWLVVAITA